MESPLVGMEKWTPDNSDAIAVSEERYVLHSAGLCREGKWCAGHQGDLFQALRCRGAWRSPETAENRLQSACQVSPPIGRTSHADFTPKKTPGALFVDVLRWGGVGVAPDLGHFVSPHDPDPSGVCFSMSRHVRGKARLHGIAMQALNATTGEWLDSEGKDWRVSHSCKQMVGFGNIWGASGVEDLQADGRKTHSEEGATQQMALIGLTEFVSVVESCFEVRTLRAEFAQRFRTPVQNCCPQLAKPPLLSTHRTSPKSAPAAVPFFGPALRMTLCVHHLQSWPPTCTHAPEVGYNPRSDAFLVANAGDAYPKALQYTAFSRGAHLSMSARFDTWGDAGGRQGVTQGAIEAGHVCLWGHLSPGEALSVVHTLGGGVCSEVLRRIPRRVDRRSAVGMPRQTAWRDVLGALPLGIGGMARKVGSSAPKWSPRLRADPAVLAARSSYVWRVGPCRPGRSRAIERARCGRHLRRRFGEPE